MLAKKTRSQTRQGWLDKAKAAIQANPGIRIKHLAFKLRCSMSYARELVKTLEQQGEVEAQKTPNKGMAVYAAGYTPPQRQGRPQRPQPVCRVYQVPPAELWRFRDGEVI